MPFDVATASVTLDLDHHRYVLSVDGRPIGRLDFVRHDDVLDLHHTEIDPAYEGHGYGGRLVAEALADIRTRGLTVRPTCSFVAAHIRRNPADADLVAR